MTLHFLFSAIFTDCWMIYLCGCRWHESRRARKKSDLCVVQARLLLVIVIIGIKSVHFFSPKYSRDSTFILALCVKRKFLAYFLIVQIFDNVVDLFSCVRPIDIDHQHWAVCALSLFFPIAFGKIWWMHDLHFATTIKPNTKIKWTTSWLAEMSFRPFKCFDLCARFCHRYAQSRSHEPNWSNWCVPENGIERSGYLFKMFDNLLDSIWEGRWIYAHRQCIWNVNVQKNVLNTTI